MTLPFMKPEPWLRSLKGKVNTGRISTPIKVRGEDEIQVKVRGGKGEMAVGQFDFSFRFRGTHGDDLEGSGRLFVPVRRPREHLPMIVSMHYEMDANASSRFLAKGIAVMTPHGPRSYKAANLMGHGINHSIAMAQLPRRLPFVDQQRVLLFGGSAGGYHALMASSFVFPVTAVYAAVPPLNLKYNINYLVKNDKHNVTDDPGKPAAPIVKAVLVIATDTFDGGRPEVQSWEPYSPVFRTELMTFPTLITLISADALVPIQQLSKKLARKPPRNLWPKGFSFDVSKLVRNPKERVSLLEVLKPKDYFLRVVKTPTDSPTTGMKREDLSPEEVSKIITYPLQWSKTRRFSIFVLDEGYPEPFCGHAKYQHSVDDSKFYEYHFSRRALSPGILTRNKLVQLMERFSGVEQDHGREFDGERAWAISRMDHGHIERWQVANGLEIYLTSAPENVTRLLHLYRRLPRELKVLDLDDTAAGKFEKNPLPVLLYHQMMALMESGDLEPTTFLMRKIVSTENQRPAGR